MGGNASTGLGSADHHSLRDMKSMGADDRSTDRDEDTNRKSISGDQNTSQYQYHVLLGSILF